MIDVAAARQAYSRLEISDIGLVHSEHKASDAFTKVKRCTFLEHLLCTGRMEYPVDEWVLRLDVGRSRELEDG